MKHTEQEIVEKILARDEKSLFSLYKTYHKPLHNFVYRKLNDHHLAEEIAHDVFLEFIESLRDFRYQCSLKTFLYTIARNKVIDHIRKKKIKNILFSTLPGFIVEGLSAVLPDETLEKKVVEDKIEDTLHTLPREYQLILRLKYIENKSVQYIAENLVKTFKSTESLLFRARRAFIKVYRSRP